METKKAKSGSIESGKTVHRLTEDLVNSIKSEYSKDAEDGKLKRVLLDMDANGKERLEVVVKVPGRTTQDEFLKFIDRDPGKAQKILVRNCLLTHIDQVIGNDFLFTTAVGAISELFQIGSYEIKNF